MKGSMVSGSMHTPATITCEPGGQASMIRARMPGTPTHSKMIGRRTVWPAHPRHHLLRTRRGDTHVGPLGVRRLLRRIDDHVGAQLFGHLAPRRREVRRHHRAVAARLQRGDHRQADGAAADHQRRARHVARRAGHGVGADRERLGHRRLAIGQAVGHLQQHGFGQHHSFAVAAREHIRVADAALPGGTGQDRHGDHPRARLEAALTVWPEVQYLGAELVAHDHGLAEIQAAADRGGAHPPADVGHAVEE